MKKVSETPLMKQYNQIKGKHPDALLLFRVGDFYETFGQDAVEASKVLGIILTKRKNGAAAEIELAGFPHHSLETYLPKLVKAGKRVAVCDQLEDPKMTKTIVKRGVTELVTPGVSFNDQVLEKSKNNFLCSLHFDRKSIGAAFLDVSTGEFLIAEGAREYIEKLISGFEPKEVIYQKNKKREFEEVCGLEPYAYKMDDWAFSFDFALDTLTKHFKTNSLKGFGIQEMHYGIVAAGAILQYLHQNQYDNLDHISQISRVQNDQHVWLDRFTVKNLELLSSHNENALTLIQLLNKTHTPMGGRLLHRWVLFPLNQKKAIEQRLNFIEALFHDETLHKTLDQRLCRIGDMERLISKIAVGKANPRELAHLRNTLTEIQPIRELLIEKTERQNTFTLAKNLSSCVEIIEKVTTYLEEEPAQQIGKGKVIKKGVDTSLDEYREIAFSSKNYLEDLQEREAKKTEIPSLKIGFNNVFGYYIEVRNTHKNKVPENWIRKQTLVNAERYVTEELKEYESKILGAEEKIIQIETQLFAKLVEEMGQHVKEVQGNAHIIAQIDCLSALAQVARKNHYCKPIINESFVLDIKKGRHPVIEERMQHGEQYIPNDILLNNEHQQIIMITGPNMSGKSAILRQTALIVLMAQMGGYVPAEHAEIGLVDKIFTRVGASDNISSGESTFMVEMNETASILNNLSPRSLVLLDEIGRGTSTYDGISIAWAITEYLHEHKGCRPKTLFATHYHELNEMCKQYSRIKNFNVSVKELNNEVLFIRKLQPGGSQHSFGIQVAKMAGMPEKVLKKANEILETLESSHAEMGKSTLPKKKSRSEESNVQLNIFEVEDPELQAMKKTITEINIDSMTPMQALALLDELKNKLKK